MSLVLTGIWGTVGTTSAVLSAFCFDFYGRRPTMVSRQSSSFVCSNRLSNPFQFVSWGLIILGSLLTVITWAVFENGGSTNKSLGNGIIACMFTVGAGYSGPANTFLATVSLRNILSRFIRGLKLTLTQYPAEIMPTAIRATGVAVSYMSQHIMIIILVQVTPLAIAQISWRFFLIFLISSSIFSVCFYFFYPETKNKTLEELEAVFGDEIAETLEEAGQHIGSIQSGHVDEKKVNYSESQATTAHVESDDV